MRFCESLCLIVISMGILSNMSYWVALVHLFSIGIWPYFVPPYSFGFLTFLIFMTANIDSMNYPVLPLILAYGFSYYHFEGFSYFQHGHQNWENILIGMAVYFLIGILWVFPRFKLFLRKEKEQLRSIYMNVRSPTPSRRRASASTSTSASTQQPEVDEKKLQSQVQSLVARNKMRFYTWIMYWPFSMTHTLAYDIIREIMTYVYGNFMKWPLYWMVKNAVLDMANDFSHHE